MHTAFRILPEAFMIGVTNGGFFHGPHYHFLYWGRRRTLCIRSWRELMMSRFKVLSFKHFPPFLTSKVS